MTLNLSYEIDEHKNLLSQPTDVSLESCSLLYTPGAVDLLLLQIFYQILCQWYHTGCTILSSLFTWCNEFEIDLCCCMYQKIIPF